MPAPIYITGIDVGSSKVRVAVVQIDESKEKPTVLGIGMAEMTGVQKGIIADVDDAVKSVSKALDAAERVAGVPIERAYVSINGSHIASQNSRGVIAVSRADGEITSEDVARVINAAQAVSLPSNREILHVLPQNYIVDGQEKIQDPVGMTGVRLEVETHMIDGSTPFIKNLTKVVNQSGVHIEDFVFAPLAAAEGVLDKRQRELGVALVDLGAGTTSMVVYEEHQLLHTAVLPLGSAHITNDVAIGLRTGIDVAEEIKKQYGTALTDTVRKSESIEVEADGEQESVSRQELADIISARLDEIFSFINKELKGINRSGLLPGGIVFTGDGASLLGVVEVAKKHLKLPARIGHVEVFDGVTDQVNHPSYAVVLGLVLWAIDQEHTDSSSHWISFKAPGLRSGATRVASWFKSFLP